MEIALQDINKPIGVAEYQLLLPKAELETMLLKEIKAMGKKPCKQMSKEVKDMVVPKLRFPEFKDSGEWSIRPLNNLAKEINEKAGTSRYKLMSITSGVGLVSQIEKFGREIAGDSYRNYLVIKKGDFAYNKSSTKRYPEGEIALLENEDKGAVPNSIFTCFRFDSEFILSKFAKYPFTNNVHGKWLSDFIAVGARANGALQVNTKDLFTLPIIFPSLPEQQKIADCLSSLDELITAHSQKLEALKAHKKGLMQQLFPAEGETVPKLRFAEFKNSGEWKVDTFDSLVDIIDGDRGINYPKSEDFYSSGYCVFLNAKNVTKNGFVFNEIQFISKEKDEMLRKGKLRRLDIVLTTRGSVGQFASYTEEIDYNQIRINSGMVILRVKSNFISSSYLYEFCKSENITTVVKKLAFGNAQQQLTVAVIKNLPLLYPKEKNEQQKISSCLSSLDQLITAQSEKIESLKTYKKGLMQQLFPNTQDINE